MSQRNGKAVVILLVDDDPGDQELTRRALTDDVLKTELQIVSDGEHALNYLYRREEYTDADKHPMPDLILLDLNMPKMNGREVLRQIKDDPDLRRIPVVILTTSQQESDILKSYDLGCNSFITKPIDLEEFIKAIRGVGNYWFELVTLPPLSSVTV